MTPGTARLRLVVSCIGLLLALTPRSTAPLAAAAPQAAQAQTGDGIAVLLQRLEQALRTDSADAYLRLMAPGQPGSPQVTVAMVRSGATRVVIRERDRAGLAGISPNDGRRLAVDVFAEFGRRAELSTWRLDVVRQVAGGAPGADEWLIRAVEPISTFASLHNLALAPREYAAKNLVLGAEDLEIRLPEGGVFVAETDEGPTALVLVGRGQVIFKPSPETEREQLKIFARAEVLNTEFTAAYVRVSPVALRARIIGGTITERPVNPEDERIASAVFRSDSTKSFRVNLGDMTPDNWSLVPGNADFLAELHTKRYGILTYALSAREAEDISLFDRAQRRNISVYASAQKLAQRGPFYDEDDQEDYDVVHYDIEASLDPLRQSITSVARLVIDVRTAATTNLTFKLADSLAVDSVVSYEFGRLVTMRVVNQNAFLVNLPKSVAKGKFLTFTITYHGRIAPQLIDREAVSVAGQQEQESEPDPIPLEPVYLYSNRSYWYPQGDVSTHATAAIRVKVPPQYTCVASGDAVTSPATQATRPSNAVAEFVFRAQQPARYLSLLVTRLRPVRTQMVETGRAQSPAVSPAGVPADVQGGVFYRGVELRTFATPRLSSRAGDRADRAADILRFYSSLIGECPYPSMTLAVVERELPGGHSPAYLAVVAEPILPGRLDWRNDPAAFPQFPEFFLAHEIAHQWWGQAVGWKNYHEQWLSEGLAQYFAALYAERVRGKGVFDDIVGRMSSWAVRKSAEGPVYLGYRIGHVKREPQLVRAVVYNKGAAVLHMLRRLIGDDAFMRGLRRFYQEWRFRRAGSDDLRRAFEAESGRSLSRFFQRWIYESRLPRLRFSTRTEHDLASGEDAIIVRVEQVGELFDLPLTVTLDYQDRSAVDVIVPVTDAVNEMRIPLRGRLHGVEVNRDEAAVVAKIDK